MTLDTNQKKIVISLAISLVGGLLAWWLLYTRDVRQVHVLQPTSEAVQQTLDTAYVGDAVEVQQPSEQDHLHYKILALERIVSDLKKERAALKAQIVALHKTSSEGQQIAALQPVNQHSVNLSQLQRDLRALGITSARVEGQK